MDVSPQSQHFLNDLLREYDHAIATLSQGDPSPRAILNVLLARDGIQAKLEETLVTADDLLRLADLDARLRQHSEQIRATEALPSWHHLYRPPASAWWWYPPDPEPTPAASRYDWLWNSLSIIFLTVSASLILNTASRFWSSGIASAGTLAVATQSVLTLIAGKGALTASGRQGWETFLKQRQVPEHHWQEWSCGAAGGVFLVVASIHGAMPWFATQYNDWGWHHFEARRLGSARQDLQTALSLRPDYAEAHFHLALVYEDLQDREAAKAEYQFVVASDPQTMPLEVWLSAHNNLARLHILSDQDAAAAPLIIQAMDRLDMTQAESDAALANVTYTLLKNLGWVRLAQQRYAEARAELERAIEFDQAVLQQTFADNAAVAKNRAAAYCLLAQVHDAQQQTDLADAAWDKCLRYANRGNPDEDAWIGLYEHRR